MSNTTATIIPPKPGVVWLTILALVTIGTCVSQSADAVRASAPRAHPVLPMQPAPTALPTRATAPPQPTQPAQPTQTAQADPPPAAYSLTSTWQDEPWAFTPGAHWWVIDAASAPDGRRWLLDLRADTLEAVVHAFDSDGAVNGAIEVVGRPYRFDAWSDGAIQTLYTTAKSDGTRRCTVRRYDTAGAYVDEQGWPISDPNDCKDIAAGPDGLTYLLMTPDDGDQHSGSSGLLVAQGNRQMGWLNAESLYPVDHSTSDHFHPVFTSVDVGADGRIYLGMYFPGCG